jgi:glycosyltransferase involved in cell wall biosynthesis
MAHFLPYVLASVEDLADEIVVVDSFSSDCTREFLSSRPKVRLFQRTFVGHFGDQKNFAISQATGDWVLILDSDEILGDRLREHIPSLIRSRRRRYYKVPRYWILEGPPWHYVRSPVHYPDFQLRLFRNEPFFRYSKEKVVHTHFPRVGRGNGKKLPGCHLFHFDFVLKDRQARWEKYERYVALEPGSRKTSRMYLFEDFDYRKVRCKEPMTSVQPDLLQLWSAAARPRPRLRNRPITLLEPWIQTP